MPKPNLKSELNTFENWNLVFTRFGKYFFHNSQTGQVSWIPPQNVLKVLKENFTPTEREMFFDPFHHVEERELEEDYNNNSITDTDTDTYDNNNNDNTVEEFNYKFKDSISTAEDEFKLYLLKNLIDPFASWSTIQSLHSHSSQFQSIPSEKRRQDLFSQVCPILIQMHREETKKKLEEAKDWWKNILISYKYQMNWFQLLKKLKGNSKFKLLNEKECEKEFKSV